MTREEKEKIARNAASIWCRCFKCDGIINDTHLKCSKETLTTCHKWYDGYRTALLALGDERLKPSISPDADEAAEECANKTYPHPKEDDFDDPCYSLSSVAKCKRIGFYNGFKDGAEWMAGQGASYDTEVGWIDGPTILKWPVDILDGFEMGDKVTVQIRKK